MGESQAAVTMQQCLFGYEDGHHMLASSHDVPDELISFLLPLTDLGPGLSTAEFESYWTGVPIAQSRYYALMKTWPAPEVSRPGCVWTHVLLIPFAEMGRIVDLRALAALLTRPGTGRDMLTYSRPLTFGAETLRPEADRGKDHLCVQDVLAVVRALYAPHGSQALHAHAGEFDDAIFRVWSQQWPRLRRSFSFRTAVTEATGPIPGLNFDLQIILVSRDETMTPGKPADKEPWEFAAIDDLEDPQPSELRRFLWRYGSDLRFPKARFRFLVELYLTARIGEFSGSHLEQFLLRVAGALPSVEDGRILKEDLLSCGASEYSLLPAADVLDILGFCFSDPSATAFPAPPAGTFDRLNSLWPKRADQILSIAERAAQDTTEVGEYFIERLGDVVEASTFLRATGSRPKIRRRLIAANPALLDSEEVARIPTVELSELLSGVPAEGSLAERLITRLLVKDDPETANMSLTRFPEAAMKVVANHVAGSAVVGNGLPFSAWGRAVRTRASDFLRGGFIQEARSTRTLAAFAAMLGHDGPEVLRAGPLPWASTLAHSVDDVEGDERQLFLVFLLAVATAQPVAGCESLFERSFEPIHSALSASKLHDGAMRVLMRHLPDVYWWQQWDKCLRLRVAVVNSYVSGGLAPESFRKLTSDESVFEALVDLADRTGEGREFVKRLAWDVGRRGF